MDKKLSKSDYNKLYYAKKKLIKNGDGKIITKLRHKLSLAKNDDDRVGFFSDFLVDVLVALPIEILEWLITLKKQLKKEE